jgi:hypothetical protein
MLDLPSRLLSPVYKYCDAPEPWQIGFQDCASPTFEGITELLSTSVQRANMTLAATDLRTVLAREQ